MKDKKDRPAEPPQVATEKLGNDVRQLFALAAKRIEVVFNPLSTLDDCRAVSTTLMQINMKIQELRQIRGLNAEEESEKAPAKAEGTQPGSGDDAGKGTTAG